MTELLIETADTFWVRIYMAGDYEQARQACREECMRQGLCVTVESASYIYTCGEEAGIVVGLINYPRFPAATVEIVDRAKQLGTLLMDRLCQRSFSIMTPFKTTRYSRTTDGARS
jgi:hypothetical protein